MKNEAGKKLYGRKAEAIIAQVNAICDSNDSGLDPAIETASIELLARERWPVPIKDAEIA